MPHNKLELAGQTDDLPTDLDDLVPAYYARLSKCPWFHRFMVMVDTAIQSEKLQAYEDGGDLYHPGDR